MPRAAPKKSYPKCRRAAAHHWVLDEPHGTSLVSGRCKHCGRVRRDFRVSEGEFSFYERQQNKKGGLRTKEIAAKASAASAAKARKKKE